MAEMSLTEDQFHALELWIIAAANRAATANSSLGMFGDGGTYEKRRDEARTLLLPAKQGEGE